MNYIAWFFLKLNLFPISQLTSHMYHVRGANLRKIIRDFVIDFPRVYTSGQAIF